MLCRLTHTLVKVLVASLIVGMIIGHFGISIDTLIKAAGLSRDRIEDMARDGIAWAQPTCCLARSLSCRCGSCSTCSGRRARAAIDESRLQHAAGHAELG